MRRSDWDGNSGPVFPPALSFFTSGFLGGAHVLQRVLPVPYFVQPTPITCQSTCLKMFASYLESKRAMTSEGANKSIEDIWREINTGNERPTKARNAYANMVWWLGKYFAPATFEVVETGDPVTAARIVRRKIDAGFPVMVSTNHDRTSGHIILIVGYQGDPGPLSGGLEFICHDPYGKFDPQLHSHQYGKRRYEGGVSLMSGGESGPGEAVIYNEQGIQRIRRDRHSAGKFFLISAVI